MRQSIFIPTLLCLLLSLAVSASATPEYSGRTGQSCKACHIGDGETGLSHKGLEYAASGYVWPPKGGYRVLGPIKKSVRLAVGMLHIIASFLWFGTILYVHILLRPAYAMKGLPKGEVRLGLFCMAVVGATGVLLTISRIKGVEVLWSSPWGILLSMKIIIYLVMVFSAFLAVFFIGPRLRSGNAEAKIPADGVFGPETLSAFDGREGRPAYLALGDKVYDATGLKLWKDGAHMKHQAGGDMTEALKKAPHGPEKIEGRKVIGKYDSTKKAALNPAQKAFYIIAYMNLGLVFLALLVISYWRWGI